MYEWYGRAAMCYAFLADVPPGEDPRAAQARFRRSVWFTRGWTLQELIAPRQVTFLSNNWEEIGSKHTLVNIIEDITGIPGEALLHIQSPDEYSVAQRFSWTATRETTRVEDRAYSLLGIFNIYMPTLYGEGEHAFRRLQEEIMRRVADQSIFAWGKLCMDLVPNEDIQDWSSRLRLTLHGFPSDGVSRSDCENTGYSSLLTFNLWLFKDTGNLRAVSHKDVLLRLGLSDLPIAEYTFSPHGIRTQLPLIPISFCIPAATDQKGGPLESHFLAILGCEYTKYPDHLLGRFCYIPPSDSGIDLLYAGYMYSGDLPETYGLFPLSPATIQRCRTWIRLSAVYICHPARTATTSHSQSEPYKAISLVLLSNTRASLRTMGYGAELRGPDRDHPATHQLTLSHAHRTVTIVFQHKVRRGGKSFRVEAFAALSRHQSTTTETEQTPGNRHPIFCADSTEWKTQLKFYTGSFDYDIAWEELVLRLSMDYASGGLYSLRVDIADSGRSDQIQGTPSGDNNTHATTAAPSERETTSDRDGQEDVGFRHAAFDSNPDAPTIVSQFREDGGQEGQEHALAIRDLEPGHA